MLTQLVNREGMSRCLRTCEQGKTPGAWRANARFLRFLKLVATAIGHVPTNVRHDIDLMLGMGQLKAYTVDI